MLYFWLPPWLSHSNCNKMQEIFDLIVFEHIVMIEEIGYGVNHSNTKLSAAHKRELDTRFSRYKKGETSFSNWRNTKGESGPN
jgi:hypothetical protein